MNRIDGVKYLRTNCIDDFCFYKLKTPFVSHIGLYVMNTDSNRAFVEHMGMSSLVSFEEPMSFDILTPNEFNTEWHKPGTVWARTNSRVSSVANVLFYLQGLLTNSLDGIKYLHTTYMGAFCFYMLKPASSVSHIGLYVMDTNTNRALVEHMGMSSLVCFEEPMFFDILTPNEFNTEWHKPGTVWARTKSRVSHGTTELGIDMIDFMSQAIVTAVRPDDFFPLMHTTEECYFFGVSDHCIGLCLPDMDGLREHADKMGVSDLIYFGWNSDPVLLMSPQKWLDAVYRGVAVMYKDVAVSVETVQSDLKTCSPEGLMSLMSLANMPNPILGA